MPETSRRRFVQGGVAGALCGAALLRPGRLLGSPFGLPIGLQLYSVREMLPTDYEGTLRKLAALGYQEVEAAGFFGHTAVQVKQAMADAGLRCVSAHYPWSQLQPNLGSILEFHKVLGAEYVICSSPGRRSPGPDAHAPLTIDDWRWNAEQFNHAGETVKAAGLRFGYHNHVAEFGALGGVVPYDELLRLTDPGLVTFEMDCGWVTVGGGDPARYLREHPERISMLHVKDFKKTAGSSAASPPQSAELGRGTTDFGAIFRAAKKGNIRHSFVEQEEFDMPPFEALKIDADYIKNLTA